MAGTEWQLALIIIGVGVCLGWIPVVTLIAVFNNKMRARIRTMFVKIGWVKPLPEGAKAPVLHQKAPWPLRPPPDFPDPNSRTLERSVSTRSRNTVVSWDPPNRTSLAIWDSSVKKSASASHLAPTEQSARRPSSVHSLNFSRPLPPSRASSIRSSTGSITATPGQPSSSRRPLSTPAIPPGFPAVAFQINDRYYDTTPLPVDRPASTISVGDKARRGSPERRPSRSSRASRIPRRRRSQVSVKSTSSKGPEPSLAAKSSFSQFSFVDASPESPLIPEFPRTIYPPPRRSSLNAQTFEPPPSWMDEPHAM